jgi:hypothetical protein
MPYSAATAACPIKHALKSVVRAAFNTFRMPFSRVSLGNRVQGLVQRLHCANAEIRLRVLTFFVAAF